MSNNRREGLQILRREGLLDLSKIPFEIHVTVSTDCVLDYFKESCNNLDVKPILLDLHLKDSSLIKDLMTSSTFIGTNQGAYSELKRISNGLKNRGFKVLREKVETVPWHPAAPCIKFKSQSMPKNCYFESHLNVLASTSKLGMLSDIATKHSAKRSTNIWKKVDSENVKIMITLRSSNLYYEQFINKLNILKDEIIANNFILNKEIIEFCIYDSKIKHDEKWMVST
jgi:hypothetical protein